MVREHLEEKVTMCLEDEVMAEVHPQNSYHH